MANYNQLSLDWAHISQDPDNWSLPDLQLAAELGKTLLERNKELETALRHQQNISDDQAQEIEYLRKQTAALREVNDSRMRIYEQLEVSIQDLEHANHRLTTQSQADKKHIASLETQVEKLESQIEEKQRLLEEEQRKQFENSHHRNGVVEQTKRQGNDLSEIVHLREELTTLRQGQTKHQALVRQLQATIDALQQENTRLEEQVLSLQHRHEELVVMEQIGRGVVCSRCLRSQEDISLTGDEDNMSIVESIMSSDHCHAFLRENLDDMCESENPYRVLIEKYENLLLLQKEAAAASQRCRGAPIPPPQPTMSLQDELKMSGEVWGTPSHNHDDLTEEVVGASLIPGAGLSEGETSSGFSDETINKGTQTEEGGLPSFLFRIMDGSDCKFSIYDEANRIESRFRKTPEYRKLFREIFDVLKRAAEAKEEGEDLPLLEDATPLIDQPPTVPPATPSQMVPVVPVSVAAQSPNVTPIQSTPTTTQQQIPPHPEVVPSPATPVKQDLAYASQSSVLTESESTKPLSSTDLHKVEVREKKDYMESLFSGVGGGRSKRKGRRQRTPGGGSSGAGGSRGGGGQRGRRWTPSGGGQDSGRSTPSSCGGDRVERHESRTPRSRPQPPPSWLSEFTPFSSASQEVARLKHLEKSYAEVLRQGRQRANRR